MLVPRLKFRFATSIAALAALASLALPMAANAGRPEEAVQQGAAAAGPTPQPKPAVRPVSTTPHVLKQRPDVDPKLAQAERLKRINAARSWGYQLVDVVIEDAAGSPFDLLVVDATAGVNGGRAFAPAQIARLQKKPDGARRLVVSYLSVGEAEDYRPDYFAAEYMTEDAPDWLGSENPRWKGNRLVRFCHEGWQRTILGDDNGRSLYNSIDAAPLYRLIELGFDGIYIDRADVYAEVRKECPDGEKKMVEFIARLAAHARKAKPGFIVILQNAEELVRLPGMMDTIDAIAKEDLFYGADHTQGLNSQGLIDGSLAYLKAAKAAGRPVFVIDYVQSAAKKSDARKRIEAQGFVPYIGPRDLGRLWLPGRDF